MRTRSDKNSAAAHWEVGAVSACDMWSNDREGDGVSLDGPVRRYRVTVTVDDELIAAVEGWRRAHGLSEQTEALGELVRLGLMSEIAKIYRLVSDKGTSEEERCDDVRRRGKQGRPGAKARAASSPTI